MYHSDLLSILVALVIISKILDILARISTILENVLKLKSAFARTKQKAKRRRKSR